MLKLQIRKKAAQAGEAIRMRAEVVSSIQALGDEDLLDLADIFSGKPATNLSQIASTEMNRRGLSL
jgi:hypothetical protein